MDFTQFFIRLNKYMYVDASVPTDFHALLLTPFDICTKSSPIQLWLSAIYVYSIVIELVTLTRF